ncbi:MAG: endonuclease [Candidatus Berkelbacteria bacterium]|nr:endonuclease [Candidatus Berkelbacteria bacterium]
MDIPATEIIVILFFISLILFLFCLHLLKKLREIHFAKRSLSTKYGKMTEQFLPFMEHYPYEPSNFRFIGTPIDGIQFEDDCVVFVEFKVNKSNLSEKQRKIKELIENKKVDWQEFKI